MPIKIVSHDASWAARFEQETKGLRAAMDTCARALHHIGSTSVPGLVAKPIIDVLAEVSSHAALDARAAQMAGIGYEVMGAFGIEGRRYFRKDSAGGERLVQVHAFESGSHHLVRHLAFRDYLRAYPDVAAEYGKLKQTLVAKGDEADGYMDGKDAFVKRVEREAVKWFGGSQRRP